MKKYNTIFLDRDGTINPDPGYISSLDQFAFYDFTFSALKRLTQDGNRFCIITNQSGVSRGLINPLELDKIHDYVKNQFMENSIPLLELLSKDPSSMVRDCALGALEYLRTNNFNKEI